MTLGILINSKRIFTMLGNVIMRRNLAIILCLILVAILFSSFYRGSFAETASASNNVKLGLSARFLPYFKSTDTIILHVDYTNGVGEELRKIWDSERVDGRNLSDVIVPEVKAEFAQYIALEDENSESGDLRILYEGGRDKLPDNINPKCTVNVLITVTTKNLGEITNKRSDVEVGTISFSLNRKDVYIPYFPNFTHWFAVPDEKEDIENQLRAAVRQLFGELPKHWVHAYTSYKNDC